MNVQTVGHQVWGKKVYLGMLLSLLMAAFVFAPGEAVAVKPVNSDFLRGAIKGYDPVAYFTLAKPVKGKGVYKLKWMGATWYFASAENREAFKQQPGKFAPQYGGYCAYAVSQGITADIDPQAWKIVDGKLYLNLSIGVQEIWEQNIPGYVAEADKNWPKILAGN
jgi:YHS domain-containing protein